MQDAQENPTPKPDKNNFLFPLSLSFNSVTIVNGIEAELVFPNFFNE
ncbi:MAG: hypothetical protein KatS3mg027_2214 [Bacteroidia bacterium]|nr:MAG: hypothetical protein KatS3mg027_2214 [Bacteroidia bacterium]